MPITLPSIEQVNEVLATFDRGHPGRMVFERRKSGIWLVTTRYRQEPRSVRYALRSSDGAYPTFRYGDYGMGGTEAIATAQLVRWLRGLPRRPLACWRYWTSETVGLGNKETVPLLERYGYGDNEMTACVLCGRHGGTDWWSRDGVTGPCCRYGRCEAEAERERLAFNTFRE